ncbi:MAG: peptidylprolyl isomerase [Desulfosarcina sp.]|nr:peptidylprolyl isomerase [Desulfobacterales bacterium]
MKIENGKIVSMNYILKDLSGKVLESTNKGKPFEFLCGKNMVVPGLERELIGLKAGDKKTIIIPPADGYGKRDKNLVLKIRRDQLPDKSIKVGQQFRKVNIDDTSDVFIITSILSNWVWLDKNHPLAGKKLCYEVEILDVRPDPTGKGTSKAVNEKR